MHKSSLAETLLTVLQRNKISNDKTLIVAVSGGCDSMALLTMCIQCKLNIVAAHVNYGLRGSESDEDESLVNSFCAQHNIRLEKLTITKHHWDAHDGSTQEKARSIRYQWFEELQKKHNAARVLTAHHANDQTETILLQFIRGGAGKSLYGMSEDNGFILRPMLGHTKEELITFAKTHQIPWREDLSNHTDAYTRNTIRHHLIPMVEHINPAIHSDIQLRSQRMHEEQHLVNQAAQSTLAALIQPDPLERELILLDALLATKAHHVLLWRWLQASGFSSQTIQHIAEYIELGGSTEPVWFHSETHDICIQNNTLCLSKKKREQFHSIHELPWSNPDDSTITISIKPSPPTHFAPDHVCQTLDASRLKFPLQIRSWKAGDVIKPLGAPGRQKVSDVLTQLKIPAWKKRDILVLESNQEIAAILGLRISDAFKITPGTTSCLYIEFAAM